MGREMRRAQQRADRRQQRQQRSQPQRSAPPITAPASAAEARRKGSLLKPKWVMDIISELKKVTWPSRREVGNLTVVVIVVSLLLGFVLGGADLAFGWLIEHTILG